MITLALSKGRIFNETLPLLRALGIEPLEHPDDSRKLVLPTSMPGLRLLVVRASDVPTYVQCGAADLGVAGSDVLVEHGGEGLYQPVDLGIGRCRMCLAAPVGFDLQAQIRRGGRLTVATKYVETTRRYFASRGMHADLIKLYGSIELAPLVGLADVIVDLVSTGATLRANGLQAFETISEVSSRLVVNQAALKLRYEALHPLVRAFAVAAA